MRFAGETSTSPIMEISTTLTQNSFIKKSSIAPRITNQVLQSAVMQTAFNGFYKLHTTKFLTFLQDFLWGNPGFFTYSKQNIIQIFA
jgi:hypothetical protein